MGSDDVLHTERHDRTAVVQLHRPEARNALNQALRRQLFDGIAAAEADDAVDVIVLTGADPAFCAGLDLRELAEQPDLLQGGFDGAAELRRPWPDITKPLIGAVNGVAVTGGLELALACDFLVASRHARFADTHGRVGVQPGWGMSVRLPQAIGTRRARQMSLTGAFIDAPTALEWGLVNEVVEHDHLLDRCLALAAAISDGDQAALRRLLATYRENTDLSGEDAQRNEWRVSAAWEQEADHGDLAERRRQTTERGRAQLR
ncbi:MAG: enoyl-CoA hydratase [Actinomycetes bacterium]